MDKTIYFDNAATTAVNKDVLETMLPWFSENYGNPSSIYALGRKSKVAIEEARNKVAALLGCSNREIFFTSCGSESDNWAIKGAAYAKKDKGNHIITTAIEHHAVLHPCQQLEKEGFSVTYLKPDEYGIINPKDLEAAITDKTIFISIIYANNEIGTIQPINELAKIANEKGVIFHTDAVQAAGIIPLNLNSSGIDLLSLSAHKFHGPKGVGVLYIRKGVKPQTFMHGGGQESGKRAGTENVAGIVGLAKALEIALEDAGENTKKLIKMRDYIFEKVTKKIPYVRINGHKTLRLPGNANFSFEFIEGEALLLMLDMEGIAASSGSACTSGSLDPSHVLLAIGLPHEIAHGSLRVSLSNENTFEEIDYFIEKLEGIVNKLRMMSPLYERVRKG